MLLVAVGRGSAAVDPDLVAGSQSRSASGRWLTSRVRRFPISWPRVKEADNVSRTVRRVNVARIDCYALTGFTFAFDLKKNRIISKMTPAPADEVSQKVCQSRTTTPFTVCEK